LVRTGLVFYSSFRYVYSRSTALIGRSFGVPWEYALLYYFVGEIMVLLMMLFALRGRKRASDRETEPINSARNFDSRA
jgi:hypothetical protein